MKQEPTFSFDASPASELEAARGCFGAELRELEKAAKLLRDRRRSEAENARTQGSSIKTLLNRGGALCHDMQSSRNWDEWSQSFAYLLQTSLAYLAAAKAARGETLSSAMIANLHEFAQGLQAVFPSGRRSVDEFAAALAAVGTSGNVVADDQPHPLKDSLARHVLIVRETGYALSGFRTFYAPSDRALHVVRPA